MSMKLTLKTCRAIEEEHVKGYTAMRTSTSASTSTELKFRLLKERFESTITSGNDLAKIRWILAATAMLQSDSAWTMAVVVPFLDGRVEVWWKTVMDIIEAQSELCVVAARFLSALLVLTCKLSHSELHKYCSSGRQGGEELVSVLIAIAKCRDPVLAPCIKLMFEALLHGPCRMQVCILLPTAGDDMMRFVFQLLEAAESRQTGTSLLAAMFETKQGARLCKCHKDAVRMAVGGTVLEREWRLVENL